MKKKLLLHIGYPKTATTTLQEDLFLNLHNQNQINYLGRTMSSTFKHINKDGFQGEDWVIQLKKYLLFGENPRINTDHLSNDKLNVLSDEGLTTPGYFYKLRYNLDVNPFDFTKKLKTIFGSDVDVKLLVTIRNQPDMIFSYFVQKYKLIMQHQPHLSFENFIKNNDNCFFQTYNFGKIISQYENEFKTDSTTILLFEDFLNRSSYNWELISKALNIDIQKILPLVQNKNRRKRDKSDVIRIKYPALSLIGKIVSIFYGGQKKFIFYYNQKRGDQGSFFINRIKRTLFNYVSVSIDEPSYQQKNKLSRKFQMSNYQLIDEYNLDKSVLKKYDYIK